MIGEDSMQKELQSKNKNDNPKLLMEAATWWIETHQLDHFEKAVKIKNLVEQS